MESVKSREIDKRNGCVIDFYRLINRNRFLSIDYSTTLGLQPAAADFVPQPDQISLRNNFFHSGI